MLDSLRRFPHRFHIIFQAKTLSYAHYTTRYDIPSYSAHLHKARNVRSSVCVCSFIIYIKMYIYLFIICTYIFMAERCDSCSASRKETMEKQKTKTKPETFGRKKVKAADELLVLYINADYI